MILKDDISFFTNKQLNKEEVKVWYTYLNKWEDQVPEFRKYISEEEKEKLQLIKEENLRNKYIVSRFLLRRVISSYINLSLQQIQFEINTNGKPFLQKGMGDIKFNISHSFNLMVIGIAGNYEIGIDVEKLAFRKDLYSVSERFFKAEENEYILSLPEDLKLKTFYKVWTLKEAYAKAKGISMVSILDKTYDHEITMNLLSMEKSFSRNNFSFHPFQIGEYIGTVVTAGKTGNVSFIEI
jgi:4'-phosphopantetheinyl transferase